MNALKALVLLVTPLSLLLTSSLSSDNAYATAPISASGTFTLVSLTDEVTRFANGNLIGTDTVTETLTGTFAGTVVFHERFVVNHQTGTLTLQSVGTFTGSVDGVSGTKLIRTTFNSATGGGHFVVLSGTGGLASLRGQGTFELTAPDSGTYSGVFHFEP